MRKHLKMSAIALCLAVMALPSNAISPPPPFAIVFFASGSAELSPTARKTLQQIVREIRNFGSPCQNVRVVGHLDRAEAKQGKAGTLDQLRAQRVHDALRDFGLTEKIIDVFAISNDSPLVQRASDSEAQNRRAHISWSCHPI